MTSLRRDGASPSPGRLQPTDLDHRRRANWSRWSGPMAAARPACCAPSPGSRMRRGEVRIDGEDVDSAPPRPGAARCSSFLPASRDVAWPIAARDVIALGLDRRDRAAHRRTDRLVRAGRARRSPGQPPVDRRTRARPAGARACRAARSSCCSTSRSSNLDPYWVLRFARDLRRPLPIAATLVLVALHDLGQLPPLRPRPADRRRQGPDGRSARRPDGQRALRRDLPDPGRADGGWAIRRRRIGDHRGEIGFGGELAVDRGPAGELAHRRPLLDELDVELEQAAGLDRGAELRALRSP